MAEVKKDCFAYKDLGNNQWTCTSLTKLFCKNEECKFYKKKKGKEKQEL